MDHGRVYMYMFLGRVSNHIKALSSRLKGMVYKYHKQHCAVCRGWSYTYDSQTCNKGPFEKGTVQHCMLDLSIGDTVWGPKNYHFLLFLFIENL